MLEFKKVCWEVILLVSISKFRTVSEQLAHVMKCCSVFLADFGISIKGGADAVEMNFPTTVEQIRRSRAEISYHDSAYRYKIEVIMGKSLILRQDQCCG